MVVNIIPRSLLRKHGWRSCFGELFDGYISFDQLVEALNMARLSVQGTITLVLEDGLERVLGDIRRDGV